MISLETLTTDPSGSENGLIVRNIPSGVQEVSFNLDGYALPVQQLKDTNRVSKIYNAFNVTGVLSETMITLTPADDYVAGTPSTSFSVTSGKILRINSIFLTLRNGSSSFLRLKINNSGAATTSSLTALTVTKLGGDTLRCDFPDGLELTNLCEFGISQLSSDTFVRLDISIVGYEY